MTDSNSNDEEPPLPDEKSKKRPREETPAEEELDDSSKKVKTETDKDVKGAKGPRDGRRGRKATSQFTEMSDNWETYAKFPKNTVPNMMRTARILDRSMREHEKKHRDPDDSLEVVSNDDIRFSKEAIPILESFMSIRFGQIMNQAAAMHRHHGMKRITAADVQLAIQSNPIFFPFNVERYLDGHREDAPAVIGFSDNLRVGKSKSKKTRYLFQHTDLDTDEK